MNKLFAPFLPPWVETGLQPAFYDMESGTVLQQTARMYDKVNQLIRLFNELSEETQTTVNEYITKFTELKDFVDDFFDNLDVQEEINNKLDAMVEDGTLAEIINQEIFGDIQQEIDENKKYKSQVIMINSKSVGGDCYIVKFANGKTMFIDTSSSDEWSHIVNCLSNLEITKFDYGIITHPHSDHNGNLQNFIDNYCDENTIFYVGATPDLNELTSAEANKYRNQSALFTLNNITPVVPDNNSVVTIDELSNTSIRFLNTDTTWFEDYYDVYGEYYTDHQTDNVFSLVSEITFENVKFLSLGDIEKCVEDKLVNYVSKTDIVTAPHHFGNKHINEEFYNNLDTTSFFVSTYNGSLLHGNIGYMKAIRENRNIVSSYQSPEDYIVAETYGYNFSFSSGNYKGLYIPKLYNNITDLISSEHTVDGAANVSLSIMMGSMGIGDEINFYLDSSFTTLISDLATTFKCSIPSGSNVKMTKFATSRYRIEVGYINKALAFIADTFNGGTTWYVKGEGTVGSWEDEDDLLALINSVPTGVYSIEYHGTSHTIGNLNCYQTLTITQITGTGYRKGYIFSVRNNAGFTVWTANFTGASGGFSWKQITLTA